MPSKKKKYNARFPAGRIKKIMQSDEEVGKVAQAVPIIISDRLILHLIFFSFLPRTLELFVESLLTKTLKITNSRNAKTLSTSHMKQCIMSEQRFDFLRELVRTIPDISVAEEAANYNEEDNQSSPEEQYPDSDTPYDLSMPSTSLRATARQQMVSSSSSSSNGHNGGHTHHHHHHQMHQQQQQLQQQQQQQHHDYQRNYLKRSISSNPNSVIRHTTSVAQTNVECLPAKLSRSDSAPVPPQLLSSSSPSSSVYHPRLKHQSYSMPSSNNDNNNKPNTHTPPKPLQSPLQQTAIPAPIVSIDYCSKPVVKIDYSNLAPNNANVASLSAPVGPLSAPANISCISGNNTPFNFSTEPVINIDLSNIVAAASAGVGVGAAAITPLVPNVATISIGTSPLTIAPPPPPQPLTTSSLNKTKLFAANAVDQQSRNSKAKMAEPLTTSITKSKTNNSSNLNAIAAATTMTTSTTSNSDSYLDMDEDYDNI